MSAHANLFSMLSLLSLGFMMAFGMKAHRGQHEEKEKTSIAHGESRHDKPTILYCADNKYYSHFEFSIELVNHLKTDYNVHFLVLDHTPEKDDKDGLYKNVDSEILLIRTPIDKKFLDENFLKHVKGGFSDWRRNEIRSRNGDLWVLEEMNTVNMYQAVAVHNPVKSKRGEEGSGEEKHTLDWLRQQNYALGIAEWGRLTAAFHIFHELGIEKTVATAAPVVNPAFYHFLQMPIPVEIPEFFAAQPKGQEFSPEENHKEYELVIKRYEKMFYQDNEKFYEKLRAEALEKKNIHLKKSPPLRDMLGRCQAFVVNQPGAIVDFPWEKPPMLKHIGGIAMKRMDLYAAKALDPEKYKMEMGKIEKEKFWKREEKCVVLFSMGTIVNFNGFGGEDVKVMFAAFGAHPKCKFLVRFDTTTFEEEIKKWKPSNVEIVDFNMKVAQQEILAQSNLHALITHCGQNTFNEAVYAGVPLICFPFFYDQPYNSALIDHMGNGIFVKPSQFAHKFAPAMHQIIDNQEYTKKAKEIARKLHQQPSKPVDIYRKAIQEALGPSREINFVWPNGGKVEGGKKGEEGAPIESH